jgi:hypothetical protein
MIQLSARVYSHWCQYSSGNETTAGRMENVATKIGYNVVKVCPSSVQGRINLPHARISKGVSFRSTPLPLASRPLLSPTVFHRNLFVLLM